MAEKKTAFKFLKLEELRTKKPAELDKYLADIKAAREQLRMDLSTNKSKGTHMVSKLKHEVARVKTVQAETRQKEEA